MSCSKKAKWIVLILPIMLSCREKIPGQLIGKWDSVIASDTVRRTSIEFSEKGWMSQRTVETKTSTLFNVWIRKNKLVSTNYEAAFAIKDDTLTITYNGVPTKYVRSNQQP